MKASLSALIMSIGSSALMAMGFEVDPTSDSHPPIDKNMARFNIDLLIVLKEKTQNNLDEDEKILLSNLINDLQMKFITLT